MLKTPGQYGAPPLFKQLKHIIMNTFKVLLWNITRDEHEFYDVLPYFQRELSSLLKKRRIRKKDITMEWLKDFVKKEAKYMFWSRCEYEIIVAGWPKHKNEEKLDAYDQIEANLDSVTLLLYENIHKNKRSLPKDL